MNKKGFVLMETIVVITVLCVILVVLYGAYSSVTIKASRKNLYENTEYLYKTSVIRDYLEPITDHNLYDTTNYYTVCRNSISGSKCHNGRTNGNYQNDMFYFLGVEAVYITVWNISNIATNDMKGFEATTQQYLSTIDATDEQAFRLVVMYKDENNTADPPLYQYASLKFGSRG